MSHFTVNVQSLWWHRIGFNFLTSIATEKYPKVYQRFDTFIKSEKNDKGQH